MTVTSVSGTTFLADTSILLRDKLLNNINDPIATIRTGNEKFIMTEYPQRAVKYPIITIVDRGISQPQRLGMSSEGTVMDITMEIRIWARNVVERDKLFDEVYNYLKNNQLDSLTGLVASNLNGFKLNSAININEPGEAGIKSKVIEVNFMFINE
jgi:hypothetical protein